MKAYKIVLLVNDIDGAGQESIEIQLENLKYVYPQIMEISEKDVGEWSDDHPLNYKDCHEAFNEIFK
jgi:hypothetical protein